ncbi:hypothetical protein [Spirosoma koreense]
MKLISVLDTLDGLDEALKGYYTEKDGKFYLGAEGVDDLPEVKGLKTSLAPLLEIGIAGCEASNETANIRNLSIGGSSWLSPNFPTLPSFRYMSPTISTDCLTWPPA